MSSGSGAHTLRVAVAGGCDAPWVDETRQPLFTYYLASEAVGIRNDPPKVARQTNNTYVLNGIDIQAPPPPHQAICLFEKLPPNDQSRMCSPFIRCHFPPVHSASATAIRVAQWLWQSQYIFRNDNTTLLCDTIPNLWMGACCPAALLPSKRSACFLRSNTFPST